MRWITVTVAAIAAASAVDSSLSDQPVAIGAGARALGMGGAFAAVADDATATTWNPAGLTQCERVEAAMSLGISAPYAIGGGSADSSDPQVRPEHLSVLVPFFALGSMQTIGVAWQRQYDYTRQNEGTKTLYDDSTPPLLFTAEDSWRSERSGGFASLGLSYAIEVQPGCSFGLTVNAWGDRWTTASIYREEFSYEGQFAVYDGGTLLASDVLTGNGAETTTVEQGTSLVLGVLWQATPNLAIAMVVKPGFELELANAIHGRETFDDGSGPIDSTYERSSTSTLHLPTSATFATAWRPDDFITATFDATWTHWRDYYIEDEFGRRSPVNSNLDPEDFDDLWTLRAGFEHVVILPRAVLAPRLGVLAEWLPAASPAPSPNEAEQTDAISECWLGATAGLGLALRRMIWDAGVQVRYSDDVGAGQFAQVHETLDIIVVTARLSVTVHF